MSNYINLDHIGIILKEEFMEPLGLSMNALANAIGVPANCIHGIVHGTRGVSALVDLRLTHYFGLSQGYFLRIQNHIDMIMARRQLEKNLTKIEPIKINYVANQDFNPKRPVARVA